MLTVLVAVAGQSHSRREEQQGSHGDIEVQEELRWPKLDSVCFLNLPRIRPQYGWWGKTFSGTFSLGSVLLALWLCA